MKPSHLLIDFDGTLVNQSRLLKVRFLFHSLRVLKGACSKRKVLQAAWAVRQALYLTDGQIPIQELSERVFEERTGLAPHYYREMCRVALEHSSEDRRIEGALNFLHWAKERFVLVLATSPIFNRDLLEGRLTRAGMDPAWFNIITSADTFHFIKPDRRYYEELLERSSLAPEDCVMIGNDPIKDFPAIQCGIPLLMLGGVGGHPSVHPVHNYNEVRSWLEAR